MSLDYSIACILDRLLQWGRLPKYSMERRVDIFLTPFLEALVGYRLGGKATLILPEFPLLASLRPKKEPLPTEDDGSEPKPAAHTVNADYLFRLERFGGQKTWLLLELKTDSKSFDEDQAGLYLAARTKKMVELRGNIEFVRDRPKANKTKYEKLLETLGPASADSQDIEIAYLGPSSLADQARDWRGEGDGRIDHYLTLADFAALPSHEIPGEHWELWLRVRDLLAALDPVVPRPSAP